MARDPGAACRSIQSGAWRSSGSSRTSSQTNVDDSRAFYLDVIGLEEQGGLDWILFFGTDQREVQLSVMKLDIKAHIHPDVSIEVDDVDEIHARAVEAGAEIVYPLTDEDWGLRRFFVRDPNGAVINVTQHR